MTTEPPKQENWSRWFWQSSEASAAILPRRVRAVNFLAALVVIVTALLVPAALLDVPWDWATIWKYRESFLAGYELTIVISAVALVLSIFCGLMSALAGRSPFLLLRYVNRLYVDLVRGTPLLVQILFFYYVTAHALGIDDRNVAGVLILSLSYGAYISEIIRAGIESIGKSQWESARAIGLTTTQTYRYVVFPQTLRQITPPLAGQLVSLIKDSALLSIIAVTEFTKNAMEISNNTYSALECYGTIAVGYLILTLPVTFLSSWLERRMRFET